MKMTNEEIQATVVKAVSRYAREDYPDGTYAAAVALESIVRENQESQLAAMEKREIYSRVTEELVLLGTELDWAMGKHKPLNGGHEGLAMIQEEVHELMLEVYKKNPDLIKLREEATQVAAMALRFIVDLLPEQK